MIMNGIKIFCLKGKNTYGLTYTACFKIQACEPTQKYLM